MTDQRPIGYWLTLLNGLIEEQFATTLDEHGVTRRQWQLLTVLSRSPSTVAQLDEAVAPFVAGGADPASSAEHLSELIDSGWVDATAEAYELTERGRIAFDRLAEVVTQQRAAVASGITEQEYAETLGVLEKMSRNLGWSD
jgi:DNA-binding MarR family transcriptional regulator